MGPVDYIVIEWPKEQPKGEVAPLIADLHERGIIRVLDVAFLMKDEDGNVAALEVAEMADGGFGVFEGASSGLLGDDDIDDAGSALEPGTSAAVLVWENRWAARVAAPGPTLGLRRPRRGL